MSFMQSARASDTRKQPHKVVRGMQAASGLRDARRSQESVSTLSLVIGADDVEGQRAR